MGAHTEKQTIRTKTIAFTHTVQKSVFVFLCGRPGAIRSCPVRALAWLWLCFGSGLAQLWDPGPSAAGARPGHERPVNLSTRSGRKKRGTVRTTLRRWRQPTPESLRALVRAPMVLRRAVTPRAALRAGLSARAGMPAGVARRSYLRHDGGHSLQTTHGMLLWACNSRRITNTI